MIKLKTFIALLIPIGLLPTFQGSGEETIVEVSYNLYKMVGEEEPNLVGSTNNQEIDQQTGLLPQERKIGSTIKKKFKNVIKGGPIKFMLSSYLKKKKSDLKIEDKNFYFWIREKKSSNDETTNEYVKLDRNDAFNKDVTVDVLVKGNDNQNAISSLFATTDIEPSSPAPNNNTEINSNNDTDTDTTITDTQPPAPSPAPTGDTNTDTDTDIEDHSNNDINNNNDTDTTTKSQNTNWTTARIVLGVAGGLAFLFSLSGAVYYFYLPEKGGSLLLLEEEEEEYDFEL